MTTDRTQNRTGRVAGQPPTAAHESGGAAIHPQFLRSGPWALSSVVALLFGLSFATRYAVLYDYALELQFPREFAIAFPLVLDAVIIVLAVTLLLERALGRRTMTVMGWRFTVRPAALATDGAVDPLRWQCRRQRRPRTTSPGRTARRSRPARVRCSYLPPAVAAARPGTRVAGDR